MGVSDYIWRDMKFSERFDTKLFSCDLKAAKPDPVFFRLAEERLQKSPEGLLLVDDSQACTLAARERGWATFHYTGPRDDEALRTVLSGIAA
jgi:putative hydrolase of the HAD superfamily